MTDSDLLCAYLRDSDEIAFTELVERYAPMVYAAALRQVKDSHLAEDVMQAVFMTLERKAKSLTKNVIISGWLFKVTRFAALDAMKSKRRRQNHEEKAATMRENARAEDRTWKTVEPYLDEGLCCLGEKDRHVIVLRFLDGKKIKKVAAELALTEAATEMRIARSLRKLRGFMKKRGVAITAVMLGGMLSSNAVYAAPAAAVSAATAAALGNASAASLVGSSAIMKGAMKMMLWAKVNVIVACTAAAVVVGGVTTSLALQALAGDSGQKSAPQKPKYIMGTKVIQIPKIPRPARGKTILDPVFGTKITRITDAADGWGEKMRRHGYSTYSPLNCDGSLITVQEARWHLYDTRTNKHIKELKGPFNDSGAPRWDAKDPNVFYFAKDTAFHKYNVKTDKVTMLYDFKKDFPQMKWLFNPAYVEPSADTRYWGFIIMAQAKERGKQIAKVTYDLKENRLLGKLPGRANNMYGRYASVSPSGKRIVVGEISNGKRSCTSYKIDFTDPVPMTAVIGHTDLGIDINGREVLIYGNDKTDFIAMQDLETGKETRLLSYIHNTTWAELRTLSGQGYHASGNAYGTPGWVVISNGNAKKKKMHWNSHTIYLMKLDPKADPKNPTIWRVAHHRSVADPKKGQTYWAESHASIDRYGKTIIFASNWDDIKGTIEDYRLDLPKGWYEKLMGKEKAAQAREKAAKLLGMSVAELVGK